MSYERTHAQLIGEGKGLVVVGSGLVGVEGMAMERNVAEEPASACRLKKPRPVWARESARRRSALAPASSPGQ